MQPPQKTEYDIDPAYQGFPAIPYTQHRWWLRILSGLIGLTRFRYRWPECITTQRHSVRGVDGNNIPVLEIARQDANLKAPAMLYLHGGAFFLTYAKIHLDNAVRYAKATGCRVFLVDYRLSTQAPFPAAQDDCQSCLEWLSDQAETLGVDGERLLVAGDSAGGCLAASCAQKTMDRNRQRANQINLIGQVLIYPVLDSDCKTASAKQFVDTPIWTGLDNKLMWDVYLHGSNTTIPPQYASPARRGDFSGLPPAYIEVAEFDPLRDEGIAYAEALRAAGVDVEFQVVSRGVHGYDAVKCKTSQHYVSQRIKALQRLFLKPD